MLKPNCQKNQFIFREKIDHMIWYFHYIGKRQTVNKKITITDRLSSKSFQSFVRERKRSTFCSLVEEVGQQTVSGLKDNWKSFTFDLKMYEHDPTSRLLYYLWYSRWMGGWIVASRHEKDKVKKVERLKAAPRPSLQRWRHHEAILELFNAN